MKHTKKILALALSIAVVASIAAAGTLAYLTSTSGEVVNTFTVGNIQIDLDEHYYDNEAGELTDNWVVKNLKINGNEYERILPGQTLPKDPIVTVKADSEDCYLYVMVANGLNEGPDGDIANATLDIADGWEFVKEWNQGNEDLVYNIYRLNHVVGSSSTDQVFPVFNTVTINPEATAEDLSNLETPVIAVVAFAHQAHTGAGEASAIDLDVANRAAITTLADAIINLGL